MSHPRRRVMPRRSALFATVFCALAPAAFGQPAPAAAPDARSQAVLERVAAHRAQFEEISRKIWENPEVGFHETQSSAMLQKALSEAGFRVKSGLAGMPTAFTAEWGSGKPVIAVLGEYDALPGLSQAVEPERHPLVEGAPGHGCGHNLFGSAVALASVSVKEWMEAHQVKGTLRFYGTPAEEGGGGKIFMIRAGLFQDVDVALTWHPSDINSASAGTTLANIGALIHFKGKAAHAAMAPEMGRSALDALELTTHALNMMREHIPQESRIHYIITKGGAAANIVPDNAELQLIVRHPDLPTLAQLWNRALNCARAGALATDTTMDYTVTMSYANAVPIDALISLIDKNLQVVGGVPYTAEERLFAERIRATMPGVRGKVDDAAQVVSPRPSIGFGSTDVGDVSWVVPTAQLGAATFAPGIPPHTWQSTACAGSTIGRKGMVVAAKTLALSASQLFADPAEVAKAQAEFKKTRGDQPYKSLLPDDAKPRLQGH